MTARRDRIGAMRHARHLSSALLRAGLGSPALFAATPAPVEGNCALHDFRFASGEVLPELRLHYTTLGTPLRDAAGVVQNAVLLLHGTSGDGQGFLREP